jgi:hypothetical protein
MQMMVIFLHLNDFLTQSISKMDEIEVGYVEEQTHII